jgi:hypothetical protein
MLYLALVVNFYHLITNRLKLAVWVEAVAVEKEFLLILHKNELFDFSDIL